ncbi:unnamed protein product [Citrullus colocynthis]|uniref:Uncharacterized protein n=1 Tax=Citrullus colocynthis TaxID=252529 RepID=A0ABP0YD07_9ROSI
MEEAASTDLTTFGPWRLTVASIQSEKADPAMRELARSPRSMASRIVTTATLDFEEEDQFDGPATVDLATNSRFTASWIATTVGFGFSDYWFTSVIDLFFACWISVRF